MKKLFVYLAATIFLSSGMVQAQSYLKFNSFDIVKGLVMSDGEQYVMAAFTIKTKINKAKKDQAVVVEAVQINGATAQLTAVRKNKNKTLYLVSIPREVKTPIGKTFEMSIFLSYPGSQLKGMMLNSTDDPGDGGPGNTTDPTVIVIKYP